MNEQIKVLDHGYVRLVDVMGDDRTIEADARVSYTGGDEEDRTDDQRRRLIRYLIAHGHNTPVEGVVFKFEVKAPIFVARQWIRHRMSSTNEISARYTELPEEFYVPEPGDVCVQSTSSKQGRGESIDSAVATTFRVSADRGARDAFRDYHVALEDGVARELARIGLPLSTYTRWMWKIDLHNLFHFLELRLDGHAQLEIRRYAEAIAGIVRERVPMAWSAFEDFRLNAVRLSGPDVAALRDMVAGYRDHEDGIVLLEKIDKLIGSKP